MLPTGLTVLRSFRLSNKAERMFLQILCCMCHELYIVGENMFAPVQTDSGHPTFRHCFRSWSSLDKALLPIARWQIQNGLRLAFDREAQVRAGMLHSRANECPRAPTPENTTGGSTP